MSTRRSTLPLVSPFRHRASRDREWKWTSPVATVALSASSSIQASISTRPSTASWTIAGTSPSSPNCGSTVTQRLPGCPDRQPGTRHRGLDRRDRVDSPVEDRGSKHGVRAAVADRGHEVRRPGRPARGDDRHGDAIGDRPEQVGVKAEPGPVTIDRGHEQLTRSELDRALGPLDGIERRRLAAAFHVDRPARPSCEAHRSRRRRPATRSVARTR